MQLLEAYELQARGKNAVLIGVSNIVGRPLALELLLAGATTTSCHRHTKNIEQYVRTADIVVSATGKRDVFDQSSIAPHAVVIDVGIHRINNKVCGDLDFDYLNNRVAYLTPVPGGVGPMTITALLQNTLNAAIKNEHTHQ
jgi:methylenetetrahydrofolate dehydrogenase (NADP+)/methenyltetrahydrofolate cyclohydrolase